MIIVKNCYTIALYYYIIIFIVMSLCSQLKYIFHEIHLICRGRNFVNKFETSSRYDPRPGDRRIQVRKGRGYCFTPGTSREQEEERNFESGTC